jgi:hypothetical protein
MGPDDAVYDPLFARRQQRDEGFLDLGGAALETICRTEPAILSDHLTIIASLRIEHVDGRFASFTETEVLGRCIHDLGRSFRQHLGPELHGRFGSIEFRYTGVTTGYSTRAANGRGQGDQREPQAETDPPPSTTIKRDRTRRGLRKNMRRHQLVSASLREHGRAVLPQTARQ